MSTTPTTVYVAEVTDGDTFRTSKNEYVRLVAVNAPERGQFGYTPAKAALQSLVLHKFVEVDVVTVDVFGRFVANVWEGVVSVNQVMRNIGY